MRLAPIPRYLPAWQPHFLSGPPGGGKTCFVASLVKALQAGETIFGKASSAPPFIGIVAADREWADAKQWYDTAGVPDLPSFSVVDSDISLAQLKKRDPLLLLDDIISTHFQAPPNSLIIIDPISYWAGGDMNRYMQVYTALIGLNRFCLQHQITVIGLAHTGKQKADAKDRYTRPQDRINGSAALLGCSGTQMALETPDQTETQHYRFTWVPHHAQAESFDLDRDPDTGLFHEAVPTAAQIIRPEILALLPIAPAEPVQPKDVLKLMAGAKLELVSRVSLHAWLKRWCDAGVVEQVAPGQYRRPAQH